MSTISTVITTIAATDTLSASRTVINDNATLRHSMNIRTIADADSPYTVQEGDDAVLIASVSGLVTIQLPYASDFTNRTVLFFITADSGGGAQIDAQSGEGINGSSNYTNLVAKYDSVRLLSNGTDWFAISMTP